MPRPFAKRRPSRIAWLPDRLRHRRPPARKPGILGALGAADQAVLRFLRTKAPHDEPVETVFKGLGLIGEYAAVWIAIGAAGSAADPARRTRWALGSAVGPLAVVANYALKVSFGRERPLIEDHPPLARAPSKLSFPSAHATSSMAAATGYGRVNPRARVPLYALASAICVSRPYLGMHYPSDVVAGAAFGIAIGGLVPGLGERTLEERMMDLAARGDGARADQPGSAAETREAAA